MARIEPLDPGRAHDRQKALLDSAQRRLGEVPNLLRTLAHAPAALDAYLAQVEALGGGELPARLREQIAVAVAGENGGDYCASAHTSLGLAAGLSKAELSDNLRGRASDIETEAALAFVRKVVRGRGRVSDGDLDGLRDAGFSTGQIVEMIAHVGMNVFTNYFTRIADTEIDFAPVSTAASADTAA